ncbi:ABC transporter ATP-binding protein [Umezawaea endophytica]|uniref:ABC transporter ATP-binding protein n=1 Tax=Umezawaea endophytica TaxID=1654476 RepID=UPI0035ED15CC
MPPPVLTGLRAEAVVAGYDPRRPVLDRHALTVPPERTVGLAGPSGSGKSTLARVLGLLHAPFSGTVHLDGEPVTGYRHRTPHAQRVRIGVLFQQPRLSVDPRLTLRAAITEPLLATRAPRQAERVAELADLVMLTPDLLSRRAHEVSDGQLQRACLARTLALSPDYLVCDEMTTMLDASTTAALVGLIRDYQGRTGAGVLAISHDAVLLRRWADDTVHLTPDGVLA